MKRLFLVLVLSLLALPLSAPAWSHPGTTDEYGCHTNRQTGEHHCHNTGSVSVRGSTRGQTSIKVKAPTQTHVHTRTRTEITGPITVTTSYPATVIQVIDGDTLVVRTRDYKNIKVRLYGIDAPEYNQPGGPEATAFLRSLQGRTVWVTEMDTDGRTVALIEYRGQSVNLDLAAQGHAWYYEQYCKSQLICGQIKAAEGEARQRKRGLWAGEPVAPWKWRR